MAKAYIMTIEKILVLVLHASKDRIGQATGLFSCLADSRNEMIILNISSTYISGFPTNQISIFNSNW